MSRGWEVQGQVRTIVLYHPMIENRRRGEMREDKREERKGRCYQRSMGSEKAIGEEKRGANQCPRIKDFSKNISSPHQPLSLVKSSSKYFYT